MPQPPGHGPGPTAPEHDPVTVGLLRVDDALAAVQGQTTALTAALDALDATWRGDAAATVRATRTTAGQELRSIEIALRQLRTVLEQSRRRLAPDAVHGPSSTGLAGPSSPGRPDGPR